MTDNNVPQRQAPALSLQAIRLEDLARILSAAGRRPVTARMLQADVDDGAPANPDGTIDLVHYAAWLAASVRCPQQQQ